MKKLENIQHILIIQLKHLGDILLTTPVIEALVTRFPSAKISILINSGMEVMVSGHPHLAEILSLPPQLRTEKGTHKLRQEWELVQKIRKKRFDLVVNLSRGDRGGWLSVFSGAKVRLGYKVASQQPCYKNWFYNVAVDQPTESIHEVEKNLRLLTGIGIESQSHPLIFSIPAEINAWANEELTACKNRPIIHVHPTSRWMFKCWNSEKMADVIKQLQSNGFCIVLSCGPSLDEIKHCQSMLHHCKPDRHYLGTLNLKQLGALISKAAVFVGVDSAPMHIAAAVRTPTVALFGPTGAENWSPWLVKSQVIEKSCACKEARTERCDWTKGVTRQCLAEISVEEVVQAIKTVLSD